jgi:hypothetical protein
MAGGFVGEDARAACLAALRTVPRPPLFFRFFDFDLFFQ